MESEQNEPIKGLRVRLTHEQYRRLLDEATQFDLQFPWLAQHRYLVCIAVVSDEACGSCWDSFPYATPIAPTPRTGARLHPFNRGHHRS
jgi:hypothetical protein